MNSFGRVYDILDSNKRNEVPMPKSEQLLDTSSSLPAQSGSPVSLSVAAAVESSELPPPAMAYIPVQLPGQYPTPLAAPVAAPYAALLPPVLQCQDLVKSYGALPALGPVSLKLYPGRIVGLLGPNGSGKTTFIKTTAGLLTPSYGEVIVCGYKPGVESKALVSYLPERTYLSSWMKVSDALDYFESFYADFCRASAINMLGSLQVPLFAHISKLSKGTREKVQLILVMARQAKLYLLDEPIEGVDPAAREYILNTIIAHYDRSAAIVISTHLITDVEHILDDYVFINRGQVVSAGPVSSVYEAGWPSLDAYFREAFRC
jgi:ABC-2 type transport system ATP-binding protein